MLVVSRTLDAKKLAIVTGLLGGRRAYWGTVSYTPGAATAARTAQHTMRAKKMQRAKATAALTAPEVTPEDRDLIELAACGRPPRRQGRALHVAGIADAVHRLRRPCCDAVLVGASTVARDDPSLTVRRVQIAPRTAQPLRVVLGRAPPRRAC